MQYDVVVCGGGLAGVAAAVAAAKKGSKVLLIEQYGFLGGCATLGLVNPFMKYHLNKNKLLANKIFLEIIERLKDNGGAWGEPPQFFDPEVLKGVLFKICEDMNANILLYSKVLSASTENGVIRSIKVSSKEGIKEIKGTVFVDATGDGDLAASAGAKWEYGDGEVAQPMTLMFRIGNIDFKKFVEYLRSTSDCSEWVNLNYIEKCVEIGAPFSFAGLSKAINKYREDFPEIPAQNKVFFSTCFPRRGEAFVNMTRVQILSGLVSRDLTKATIMAYWQAYKLVLFLKKHVPGFEEAYLLESAPIIGVRETRRIIGEYVLTADDILKARKFDDAVAAGCYPIDIHPMRPSDKETIMKGPPPGDYYEIPYRCLVPLGLKNLLVTGRCISATHEAQAAIRVMPIACSLGEAAGYAAALAVEGNGLVREIDINTLQKLLDYRRR